MDNGEDWADRSGTESPESAVKESPKVQKTGGVVATKLKISSVPKKMRRGLTDIIVVTGLSPVDPDCSFFEFLKENEVEWTRADIEYDKETRICIGRATLHFTNNIDAYNTLQVLTRDGRWKAELGYEFTLVLSNLPPEANHRSVAGLFRKFSHISMLLLGRKKEPPRHCKGSARVTLLCPSPEYFGQKLEQIQGAKLGGNVITFEDKTPYLEDRAIVLQGLGKDSSYYKVLRLVEDHGKLEVCWLAMEEGNVANAYVRFRLKQCADKALATLKAYPFVAAGSKVTRSYTVVNHIVNRGTCSSGLSIVERPDGRRFFDCQLAFIPREMAMDGTMVTAGWTVVGSDEAGICRLFTAASPPFLPGLSNQTRIVNPPPVNPSPPQVSHSTPEFLKLVLDEDWVFIECSGSYLEAEKHFRWAVKGILELACVAVFRKMCSHEVTGTVLLGIRLPRGLDPPIDFLAARLGFPLGSKIEEPLSTIPSGAYADFAYSTRGSLGKLKHTLILVGGDRARLRVLDRTRVLVEKDEGLPGENSEEGSVCVAALKGASLDTDLADVIWTDEAEVWLRRDKDKMGVWTRARAESPSDLLCSVPVPRPGAVVMVTLGPPLSEQVEVWSRPRSERPVLPKGWYEPIFLRLIFTSVGSLVFPVFEDSLVSWLSPDIEIIRLVLAGCTDAPLFTALVDLWCPTQGSLLDLLTSFEPEQLTGFVLRFRVDLPLR